MWIQRWSVADFSRRRLDEAFERMLLRSGLVRPYRPASREERGFLDKLRERPDDKNLRHVYADWLEGRGEANKAMVVRDFLESGVTDDDDEIEHQVGLAH